MQHGVATNFLFSIQTHTHKMKIDLPATTSSSFSWHRTISKNALFLMQAANCTMRSRYIERRKLNVCYSCSHDFPNRTSSLLLLAYTNQILNQFLLSRKSLRQNVYHICSSLSGNDSKISASPQATWVNGCRVV